ncbi:MAG TPA: SGNH/GDSL hydrolase family protein [Vicinamibacterales bacterium]
MTPAPHIVLLGDSIFDNSAYTGGEPDVATHLRRIVPAEWRATLCAVDGATTSGIRSQVKRTPADATHLVVSVGGNDALGYVDLLSRRVESTAAALQLFAAPLDRFALDYEDAIGIVARLGKPLIVCTIYNGRLERSVATPARIALGLFNDVIQRAANQHHATIIELRSICNEPGDYANPIEPSGPGGLKIARAVAAAVESAAASAAISSRGDEGRIAAAAGDPAERAP